MNKELFISTRGKTHVVALTVNSKLVEFNRENEDDFSIVGNIYKGKITQVLKGMQAAFVNIGRKKNGYLYVGESALVDDGENVPEIKPFSLSVKEGDVVMVQVGKAELGTKGARLTANVSIPGRYLVYMPYVDYVGISRKIVDESRRTELVNLMDSMEDKEGGYIVRTACLDAEDWEILEDAKRLKMRWKKVQNDYQNAREGELVFKDGGLLYRVIRDVVDGDVSKITVDDKDTFSTIKQYLEELGVESAKLCMFEEKEKDLFNYYGLIEPALKVLDSKVELENGGYLVIEETEALTVIDVNTGRFVGEESLEETVFNTNLEAAKAVASQLRLRDLGGIIVVDFIDMQDEKHNEILLEKLREYVARDRVRTSVVDMTALGLVEITRKKSRRAVASKMRKPCPVCKGRGFVMTNETLFDLVKAKLFDIFSNESINSCLITLSRNNAREFVDQRALSFEISVFWQDKRIYVCPSDKFTEDNVDIKSFEEDVLSLPDEAVLLY
ncbi:MAG: Rne/Rng family ribonuclease [Clostridia bacterium]|nr:Rne/Rng family ribonuclease [Clostridia bacterium]